MGEPKELSRQENIKNQKMQMEKYDLSLLYKTYSGDALSFSGKIPPMWNVEERKDIWTQAVQVSTKGAGGEFERTRVEVEHSKLMPIGKMWWDIILALGGKVPLEEMLQLGNKYSGVSIDEKYRSICVAAGKYLQKAVWMEREKKRQEEAEERKHLEEMNQAVIRKNQERLRAVRDWQNHNMKRDDT